MRGARKMSINVEGAIEHRRRADSGYLVRTRHGVFRETHNLFVARHGDEASVKSASKRSSPYVNLSTHGGAARRVIMKGIEKASSVAIVTQAAEGAGRRLLWLSRASSWLDLPRAPIFIGGERGIMLISMSFSNNFLNRLYRRQSMAACVTF